VDWVAGVNWLGGGADGDVGIVGVNWLGVGADEDVN